MSGAQRTGLGQESKPARQPASLTTLARYARCCSHIPAPFKSRRRSTAA
ncbi:MAG: hypothetical protein KGI78_00895 [Patescibacteria group bacterium]|nr:hypothetical protein [Patescibacteria group bacterium]MDE1944367.1 hypothetical protein [Patescibacteria group bacterium]MDE1944970.1 hypothetical protein [Patescibacteria group bacterium]MDE2057393.1 hypothetical protein [Patescibacteria group bacterium]